MPFPEFSVNRSGYESEPADVLIPRPSESNRDLYKTYGVIALPVDQVRVAGVDPFAVDVAHLPEQWNYFHCHVTCTRDGAKVKPTSNSIRKAIRTKLWQSRQVVIEPPPQEQAPPAAG